MPASLTIVTPSFNQGRFLAEALDSVRMQGVVAEHLILDGGSTDTTVQDLEARNDDPRWSHLRWSSGPDGGQSDALNQGFRLATGEIIGWLNADDRYRPHCFAHVLQAFEENPNVDVVYGDYTLMDEDGAIRKVRREIQFNAFILLYHHILYIPTTTTFFRRRIFEEGNYLRSDLHFAMDYEFFLRLASAGYRIRHIPYVLADFRVHAESKSCSNTLAQAEEKDAIMRAASPLTRCIRSRRLRGFVFVYLRILTGLLRWTEKFFRGAYFIQPQSLSSGRHDAHPRRS